MKLFVGGLLMFMALPSLADYSSGYYKSDGTYVPGGYESDSDRDARQERRDAERREQRAEDSDTRYIGGYERPDYNKPRYVK